ncbi:unnamed protein product [Cyclocybe aegerita]|uniref:Uncharacterized protein n=1 Tax=Cyclocybe aegerita TaxID=1973307 RepID=A0A8S0VZC1_CYCAE|nr:unnamed protein product [Cyclocybe aegerita]
MKSILSLALVALLPCIKASFPGSTFGIVYNTTSSLIPSAGHLAVFQTETNPPGAFYTTISPTTPDIGGYFTVAGVSGGVLHNACSDIGIAVLVPPNPPINGLKYVLQWTPGPLNNLPEGSLVLPFQLGPAPTYDTIVNTDPQANPGTFKVVPFGGEASYVVGWADDETDGSAITLVKTGTQNVQCP